MSSDEKERTDAAAAAGATEDETYVYPACKLQPKWEKPCGGKPEKITHDVGLMMMNSLTRRKEKFVTIDGGREVKWYMCGPTVYAPSHMGHARTYLGFDIIRRILTHQFGYNVTLVMNITDIDDKIIARSNEQGITSEQLARQFEAEFHDDMEALGVLPPDVLSRVTEYMDEVVQYIQVVIDKGFAYESNGSVYFNVEGFEAEKDTFYCKCEPEQIHNAELLAEGEGKLTQTFGSDKKSPRDFALWKKSKEGEPKWESPWGPGRPGWHIECSVMASDVFSQMSGTGSCANDIVTKNEPNIGRMDIHSGGIDLKFPHHDNEMAQSEAHSGCSQWVNYFVHSGHLHIKGFKMSKSLKNFITIQQALEQNTARQMRMCFLLHKYNAPMDYGDNTMNHAMDIEKIFTEFFANVKAVLRKYKTTDCMQKWDEAARKLQLALDAAKKGVDDNLKDDFDTPKSLTTLAELVKAVNLYLEYCESEKRIPVTLLLRNAAKYVTRIFKMYGLIPDTAGVDIGFPIGSSEGSGEEALTPILDALIDFRSSVRSKARDKDVKGVLEECDTFRDDALPPLGIRLEDKADESIWKLADAAELMKEREKKLAEKLEKEEKKRRDAEEKAKKDALNKMPPAEFMKQLTVTEDGKEVKKYSKFDEETGMPTHLHNGEELTKGQLKKATKEFKSQQGKYDKAMKS